MSQLHKDVLAQLMPVELGETHQLDMQIEGKYLDAAQASAEQLLKEMFADSTYALLEDWERTLGLPDPCTGRLGTVAERIEAVKSRWAEKRKISAAGLVTAAAALGYDITVTPYAARRYGQAHWGTDYVGLDWARTITVDVAETTVKTRHYGSARHGERYATWGNAPLECLVLRLRPAHVYVVFSYGQ